MLHVMMMTYKGEDEATEKIGMEWRLSKENKEAWIRENEIKRISLGF